jgi:hypothetical protein
VTVGLEDVGDGRTEMRFQERGVGSPDKAGAARCRSSRLFERIVERLTPG